MKSRLDETELKPWQALLHAHRQVTRKLDAELQEEYGFSLGDYDVLLRLARAPAAGLRMTELAERVMISPSGLTRRVDRLVREGFVQRDRHEGDSRVMLARLTDRGRRVVKLAARSRLRGIRGHLTGRVSLERVRGIASVLGISPGR